MVNVESKPLFTLAVTAEIIGVHPRTLMIYEDERLVVPARTRTNRRRYSQQNIRTLEFIQFLTRKKGINLAGVAVVLQMINEGNKKGTDLRRIVFPEFVEKQLI
jgi:MerR family transcriptional regulator, heat shock protein HspR